MAVYPPPPPPSSLLVGQVLITIVAPVQPLYTGFIQLGAGLSVGLAGLAAGFAIGIVGDAGVRGTAQQPKLFVGMILILIFAEVLGLYGLIVALLLNTKAGGVTVCIHDEWVSDDSVRKLGIGMGGWILGRKIGTSGSRMSMWSGLKDVALNFVIILFIRTLVYSRVGS